MTFPRRLNLRGERGSALITSLWVLVAMAMVSGVAVAAANVSIRGSTKDGEQKNALAVADAGLQKALYRQNKVVTTVANPCVIVQSAGGASQLAAGVPSADGWCPAVTGVVSGNTFSYRAKPSIVSGTDLNTRIVSTASVNGQSRRVVVTAKAQAQTPGGLFGNNGVQSLNDLTMNGNAGIGSLTDPTSAGTNKNIIGNGTAKVCGPIQVGPGGQFIRTGTAGQCTGFGITNGTISMGPPSLPSSDGNSRFFALDPKTGSVAWNATTRELSMSGNASLTLGGSVYRLCKFSMSGNAKLYIAGLAKVQIYIDSPEHCGYGSGVEQVSISGNGTAINSGLGKDPTAAQFYMLGSDTLTTKANLSGNGSAQNFVFYAPRTDVNVAGNGSVYGAIAGKSVSMDGNAKVYWDPRVNNIPPNTVPVSPLFRRDRYVECKSTTGSQPDSGC